MNRLSAPLLFKVNRKLGTFYLGEVDATLARVVHSAENFNEVILVPLACGTFEGTFGRRQCYFRKLIVLV